MSSLTVEEKRAAIDVDHAEISISRQCELIGMIRSTYYYQPQPVSQMDLDRMHVIDEVFLERPYYGSRRLSDELTERGYPTCREHTRRLMRVMGIEAVYPKKRLTLKNPGHKVYPYLLRGLKIIRPNQVWCSDITYIRLKQGFAYLVAVMDWYSRYVLSWELSMSLDSDFCLAALGSALDINTPEIFNTDQGCQYTSEAFTGELQRAGVRISMDGKGRAFDNIMIERLWRTVKYEEVYLKSYEHLFEARDSIGDFLAYYNEGRRHSSLEKRTPAAVYWEGRTRSSMAG